MRIKVLLLSLVLSGFSASAAEACSVGEAFSLGACVPVPSISSTDTISFWALANHRYVRAQLDSLDLIAGREGISTWETFEKFDLGGGLFAFKSNANNKFVSVQGDSDILMPVASAIGPWEQFTLVSTDDGYVGIRSMKNGKFVTAEAAGALSLRANRDFIGVWERFVLDRRVDIWMAATAFARFFPTTQKVITSGGGHLSYREYLSGTDLWATLLEGYPGQCWPNCGNRAEPVWDHYGLQMLGPWEVFTIWSTTPEFNPGSTWNIPRSVRYLNPFIGEESPHAVGSWNQINLDCTQTQTVAQADEWGWHSPAYMVDLGHTMGSRWVIDLHYKNTQEYWTLDLGPAPGVFAPLYGFVGYANPYLQGRNWFGEVTDQSDSVAGPPILVNDRCHR
jgi:hypothetical protein